MCLEVYLDDVVVHVFNVCFEVVFGVVIVNCGLVLLFDGGLGVCLVGGLFGFCACWVCSLGVDVGRRFLMWG